MSAKAASHLPKPRKVRIIGVPLDLGARCLGVSMGPAAIRYAELRGAFTANGIDYSDYGDVQISKGFYDIQESESRGVIAEVSEEVAREVANAMEKGEIPVILGGDHSASIGSIAGATHGSKRTGLVWFDAHPDSNTPETSPSGNIHGMTVAISLGHGFPELVNCFGRAPKIRPRDVCLIGINNIDAGERAFLRDQGVFVRTLMDIERQGIVSVMDEVKRHLADCDRIHVSLDVDVLDPAIAPGTGIATRGGLSYREICYAMNYLAEWGQMTSLDVIEVNPLRDKGNKTAELAVELITLALGGTFSDYERLYLRQQNEAE